MKSAKPLSAFDEKTISLDWTHYLTRPFSLFGASIWNHWFLSKEFHEVIGTHMPYSLSVETHPGVVRNYRIKGQLDAFQQAMETLSKDKRKIKDIFRKGFQLNEQARKKLNSKNFLSLKKEIDFHVDNALHAGFIPYWIYDHLSSEDKKDKEVTGPCERLRATSFYPRLINGAITPLAIKRLAELGVKNPSEAAELVTLSELLSNNIKSIDERRKKRKLHLFIYQSFNNKELVEWTKKPEDLIAKLEEEKEHDVQIKGTVSFAGTVRGIARLILTNDFKGKTFNKGDILVAASTNPELMPLLRKTGGIVTDEGGMMCHASIIARELHIPCIVGTKNATKIIKDGDLVEVDAKKGEVHILKKARKNH
jgi:phosphoenolpyruvate synthase/pyruvate phosphate dikinase